MGPLVELGTLVLHIPLCGFLYSLITKVLLLFASCVYLCDYFFVSSGPLGMRGGFMVSALEFHTVPSFLVFVSCCFQALESNLRDAHPTRHLSKMFNPEIQGRLSK